MEKLLKSSEELENIIKKLQALEGKIFESDKLNNKSNQSSHKDKKERGNHIHQIIVDSITRERWF